MSKIFISLLAILMVSLSLSRGCKEPTHEPVDTLHHPKFETYPISTKCLSQLGGYNLKFGIAISNYYTVIDCLPINLNDDMYVDTIVVLSPISLKPQEDSCDFSFDRSPKRLLVELINKSNDKSKIRGSYKNIVSDTGGVLSHFKGIFLTENGFKIIHEAGAKYSWSYSTELSVGKSRIALNRISKICMLGENADSLIYQYDNFDLNSINIPDTLASQCNCDVTWSRLDR